MRQGEPMARRSIPWPLAGLAAALLVAGCARTGPEDRAAAAVCPLGGVGKQADLPKFQDMGAKNVPGLIACLRSDLPSTRLQAQMALRIIGEAGADGAPALLEVARVPLAPQALAAAMETRSQERDAAVWRAACSTLAYGGVRSVPALVAALEDASGAVRLCAATALLDLGTPDAAVAALADTRHQDADPEVQRVARTALERRASR